MFKFVLLTIFNCTLSKLAGRVAKSELKSGFLNRCDQIKLSNHRIWHYMQDNLNIICQFADTITNTLKRFVELCKEEKLRRETGPSEFSELQNELIKQRKKRMELEDMVRRAGNSTLSDPSLTDLLNNHQERRRPQTPFTLFMANYREKAMRQNPSFTLPQVTRLAKIKWNLLKREQQDVYRKKLEDMNKYYLQQGLINNKTSPNNDHHLVKREFECENEVEKENQDRQNQDGDEAGERSNGQCHNQQFPNNEANHIQNTMVASFDEEEHPASNDHQVPKEKSAIENILDLFHTQQKNPDMASESHHPLMEMSMVQQPLDDASIEACGPAGNVPSLVMIDPATVSHPIVIPPTIQE